MEILGNEGLKGASAELLETTIKKIEALATPPVMTSEASNPDASVSTRDSIKKSEKEMTNNVPANESSSLFKMLTDHPYITGAACVCGIAAVAFMAYKCDLLGDGILAKISPEHS